MMIKKIIISLLLIVTFQLNAQQIPFGSMYYVNMMTLNPAMTGKQGDIQAFISNRSQYMGVQGSPQTNYFSIDGLTNGGKVGLGLTATHDVTDILSKTSALVNYSYLLKIDMNHHFRFGLAAGAQNYRIDFSKANVIDAFDNIVLGSSQSKTGFCSDFGISYEFKDFQFGFAIPQLLNQRTTFNTNSVYNLKYSNVRHIRSTVKYDFFLSKSKGIKLYPMVMLRYVNGAPLQWDLNAVADYKKWGWVGISYHDSYAMTFSAGIRFHNLTVGYAYDMSISKVSNLSKRSMEFVIGYQFGSDKKQGNNKIDTLSVPLKDLVPNDSLNQELIKKIERMQNKLDTLHDEMEYANEKIDYLEKMLDSLSLLGDLDYQDFDNPNTPKNKMKNQSDNGSSVNKKSANEGKDEDSKTTDSKINNNTVIYIRAKACDFVGEKTKKLEAGYYVIIGAFQVDENATKYKLKAISNGDDAEIIRNRTNNFKEVNVFYSKDKEEAINYRKKIAEKYVRNWILILE